MHLLILSGRSGSGKTVSLNALEDLGFYCVDNLPVNMLPELISKLSPNHNKLAVSIDARNLPKDINELKSVIALIKTPATQCDILYLDAEDTKILMRFSETRRKHPLTASGLSLKEALRQEQALLSPLANMADLTIDTTELSKHQLCSLIWERVGQNPSNQLQVLLQSFGYKNGLPCDSDFIFDVRCLPNPYWQPGLRAYTGKDQEVAHFLDEQPDVKIMIESIYQFLENWVPKFEQDNRSYLTVSIGCTGGQHRSVYIAERLLELLKIERERVQARHRDLQKTS